MPTWLWSILASVPPLAILSWLAKPVIDFWRLRRQVRQELIFRSPFDDKDAVVALRRLGVEMGDISPALRWCLTQAGFDVSWAGDNLIGLSNALADPELDRDWRILYTNEIQVSLKLPRFYIDSYLATLKIKTNHPRPQTFLKRWVSALSRWKRILQGER